MSRILSLLNMAYRFNRHMVTKPLADRTPGKQRFIEHYGPDRLLPLDPQARAQLPRLHGCIACGLCDTVCPADPSDLASCLTRSLPDYGLIERELRQLECGDCRACEQVCPAGVPLREMLAFARALIQQLLDSRDA